MDKEKIASVLISKNELDIYKMTENNRTFNNSELKIVKLIYFNNIELSSLLELIYG